MPVTLTSSAFGNGDVMPRRFTCDGENLPPPLCWSPGPDGTRSFALTMEDLDARGGTFTHWVLTATYATRRTAIGKTRQRMYATKVATAKSPAVTTAELISFRTMWKKVALTITNITPAAAHGTSHG